MDDVGDDGVGDKIERLQGLRGRRARLDAEELALLADISAAVGDDRGVAEELTPVLRVSTREVERRIDDGASLVRRMPQLLDAMRSGELEAYGARRVLAVVDPLDDEAARSVDALLADKLVDAPETAWQPGNLAQRVRRLVERVDPGGQVERSRRARVERKLELAPGEHVMSSLEVSLPAEVAAACYSRVDGMARSLRRGGDQRTLDQLRADVTADLLLGRDPGVTPLEAAAMVSLHIPVDAALAISDEGCELDGYGPVPAPIAREIMTNERSIWRAVLCDPGTGEPVDLGRRRRRPSAVIRELVRVRDRECVMPWCHRPARHCDHDHEHPWATTDDGGGGGSTSVANGGPRCRRHHRLKDQPGWNTRYDPVHGNTRVTTPHGATYTAHRHPILTPTRTAPTRDTSARCAARHDSPTRRVLGRDAPVHRQAVVAAPARDTTDAERQNDDSPPF
ncbi:MULTISPECIES: 13E12 repeat family protein [Prauserella salsuginis group]|uniref:13E12 repeat family protein n=1 Tax=Prauserella salsuginis TaxID=387889 RepID=A0ABW6FWV4_9PSEU|nr:MULTISPECIES: 13E12 repeat family protein [Prauserella salsuginis group]